MAPDRGRRLQLADLGAEIIKIETPPFGDVSRMVPPGAKDGDSLFYQCLNRGKKSITLDLKKPGGMDTLYRLLPAVDVLFANPKGTMPDKMGLTYEHLKEYNPKLICCFLTGYGRVGPKKGHPGYDYLAQALSGNRMDGGGAGRPAGALRGFGHRYGRRHQRSIFNNGSNSPGSTDGKRMYGGYQPVGDGR